MPGTHIAVLILAVASGLVHVSFLYLAHFRDGVGSLRSSASGEAMPAIKEREQFVFYSERSS